MEGSTYPTLGFSLCTYIGLLIDLEEYMADEFALRNPNMMRGLRACYNKIKKYLDQSSSESFKYYHATSMSRYSLLSQFSNHY